MNFFNAKTCWSNAEFVVLKLCLGSAYLFIGSYFHAFFQNYHWIILAVFGVTVLWSMYLWLNKIKSQRQA